MRNPYYSKKPRKAMSQKPCGLAKVVDVKYEYDPKNAGRTNYSLAHT